MRKQNRPLRNRAPLTAAWLTLCVAAPLSAAQPAMAFSVEEKHQSYTITEEGRPVLTYRFGEVPLPGGATAHHFTKAATPYNGAYFTDGSEYGGGRSNYIYPLYGFHGEPLTADYPKDHLHHRSLWWSWCEVWRNEKLGDLWAVCKIRAFPLEITKKESGASAAVLQAINVWRYDDDPTDVVRETVTLRAHRTEGIPGARSRAIDVDVRLEALVEGVAIAGRQKVDYGGYGGMTVRLNPEVRNFSLRTVHPNPDQWRGDALAIAERVIDPAAPGDAAWMALYGRYPASGIAAPDFTTLIMFESRQTPLYPNQFRYYPSTCVSLAFPGRTRVPLTKGKPIDYRTRFVIVEGKTTLETERAFWDAYQR